MNTDGRQMKPWQRACAALSLFVALCVALVAAAQNRDEDKGTGTAATERAGSLDTPSIRIWDLAVAGGIFMIPIAAMSVLAVTMALERLFALRRQRVLPAEIVNGLNELEPRPGELDIGAARKLCLRNPSAAANVVKAM